MGVTVLSLSARRAWIEIANAVDQILPGHVALRKESVDRNLAVWIEIVHSFVALRKESVDRNRCISQRITSRGVALRKESVDRNMSSLFVLPGCFCRSPQGERG